MVQLLLINLCSSIIGSLYSDFYLHFQNVNRYPYRYYYAILICMLFTCISVSLSTTKYVILLIPVLYLAAWNDYCCGEIPNLCWLIILLVTMVHGEYNWISCIVTFLFTTFFALQEMLGFGDVKLLSIWALYRGEHIIYALFFASVLAFIMTSLKQKKGTIMFAPYLCVGFLLAEALPFFR